MSAYRVADLGAQGSAGSTDAVLNARGQVLMPGGSVATSTVYTDGETVSLASLVPKLARHRNAKPMFIDDAGDVVGTFYTGRTITFPGPYGFPTTDRVTDVFLFDGRRFRDLGVGTPQAVAGNGVVAWLNGVSGRSFIYYRGHRHRLAVPTAPVAADRQGDAVAGEGLYSAATGKAAQLPINPALAFIPKAMNANDQIIGMAGTACIFSGGQLTNLGTLGGNSSSGSGINDEGVAVGTSATPAGSSAFVYSNGRMTDLRDLAPETETGWSIQSAFSINNAGQILAAGVTPADPSVHLLLLTPTG